MSVLRNWNRPHGTHHDVDVFCGFFQSISPNAAPNVHLHSKFKNLGNVPEILTCYFKHLSGAIFDQSQAVLYE